MTSRPLDIILLIIDAVGTEETSHATLSACALTCRAMRRHSQVLLFNTVWLSTAKQCELFAATIHEKPEYGRLVERIIMEWRIDCALSRDELDDHPLPPHVVARLTSLKAAEFIDAAAEYSPTTVPLLFCQTFGSLATMTELMLQSIVFEEPGDMVQFLWSCPYVQSLNLAGCRICADYDPETDVLPTDERHPRLHQALTSLTVDASLPIAFALSPMWGDMIVSLSMEVGVAHSSEHLAGLAHFTRLRSLTLRLSSIEDYSIFWEHMLCYVSAPSIQEVIVKLWLFYCEPKTTRLITSAFTLGEGSTNVLTTWQRLEKVVWVLRYYASENLDKCEAAAREVEEKVPASWLRSRFTCKVDTT
ncbi:hypothetical protein L226DRAFT_386696 [Lentinus tigrinus ALCF2SS1-7]|uniref:F-box domain-containing protein n=1 Tax=Lentinus tigrinus ALCF2SS1-6 TaxID=1328759 RepID=A0A5C2S9T4_9APHY|nr:hypothetical protein L227DRAFT_575097 [Lentinus tigrinus ALCF2SS1-6]RPD75723.1 hypothetical protein L226DRAFT_386696 [Lentinus tigrinus ALCF2SS1-7]